MTVVACPDKFRGSLTATVAADAMADGLADAGCRDVVRLPLADGGEGTADVLLRACGGTRHDVRTCDALGRPITGSWIALADGTAVVESATSIGLDLLGAERDPVAAGSAGLGEVLRQVLATRPPQLLVTVGGTATTDGGLGALEVLGRSLQGVPTTVLCDVETVFVDAARVFAPQKGADPAQVDQLEERLSSLAEVYGEELRDVRGLPGSGAGGGLAGGLAALGAQLRPGFAVVAGLVGLDAHLRTARLVMTGEGRLDRTSLQGKVVGAVLARAAGRRAVVVGAADAAVVAELTDEGIAVRVLQDGTERDTFGAAGRLVREAARELAATD